MNTMPITRILDLEETTVFLYRSSQYSSIVEAYEAKAVTYLETMYGYGSTMDGLRSCCNVANMLDEGSQHTDIRAVVEVNGNFNLGEVYLSEVEDRIDSFLVYSSMNQGERLDEKDFQNFLKFHQE